MIYLQLLLTIIYTFLNSILALLSLPERSYSLFFTVVRIYCTGILAIFRIKIKVEGQENIESGKLYVFAANHASMFDISVLQRTLPFRSAMVFKKELGSIPFFGWALRFGPYVMIDRKNAESAMRSIERAKYLMEERNISILIFPEGTRSETGEVLPFKRGAFYLAGKMDYPIVPVSIVGSNKVMKKGSMRVYPGTITVKFHQPIPVEKNRGKAQELALMDQVRNQIIQGLEA